MILIRNTLCGILKGLIQPPCIFDFHPFKKILFDWNRITPFPSLPSSHFSPSYLRSHLFQLPLLSTWQPLCLFHYCYTHTNVHTYLYVHTYRYTQRHTQTHTFTIQPAESSFVAREYTTSKLTIPHYITNKGAHTRGRLIFLSSEVISCLWFFFVYGCDAVKFPPSMLSCPLMTLFMLLILK